MFGWFETTTLKIIAIHDDLRERSNGYSELVKDYQNEAQSAIEKRGHREIKHYVDMANRIDAHAEIKLRDYKAVPGMTKHAAYYEVAGMVNEYKTFYERYVYRDSNEFKEINDKIIALFDALEYLYYIQGL